PCCVPTFISARRGCCPPCCPNARAAAADDVAALSKATAPAPRLSPARDKISLRFIKVLFLRLWALSEAARQRKSSQQSVGELIYIVAPLTTHSLQTLVEHTIFTGNPNLISSCPL